MSYSFVKQVFVRFSQEQKMFVISDIRRGNDGIIIERETIPQLIKELERAYATSK